MAGRDPFHAPPVQSRRGGPVKAPLGRDVIVTTALELLSREGLEGMSLRKVAAALDTGPASLYAYVENLGELRALVLDRALGSVKTERKRGPGWRRRLRALLRSYLQVLFDTPGLAQLALSTMASGPNALRILEELLALLAEGKVERATAPWAVDLLTLYVTAIAAEQSQRVGDADPLGPLARALEAVSATEYPRIAASRAELVSGPGRFEWALDVLLTGILATPRAGTRPREVNRRRAARDE